MPALCSGKSPDCHGVWYPSKDAWEGALPTGPKALPWEVGDTSVGRLLTWHAQGSGLVPGTALAGHGGVCLNSALGR